MPFFQRKGAIFDPLRVANAVAALVWVRRF